MEVERPANISFGTAHNRDVFPDYVPRTRFGKDLPPLTGSLHRGPGKYSPEEYTNMWNQMKSKISSISGYTLGARTTKRMRDTRDVTPCPTAYNTVDSVLAGHRSTTGHAYKPFGAGTSRFPQTRKDVNDITPGPGAYGHGVRRFRKVQWLQAFGSEPVNLPSVRLANTLDRNADKLLTIREEKKYHGRLAYLEMFFDED